MLYSIVSLNSTVSCGTMPIAARRLACWTSRMSWPSIVMRPPRDVVEAIEQPRERRFARARRPDDRDVVPGRDRERHVEQDLRGSARSAKSTCSKRTSAPRDDERRRAGRVGDLGVLLDQPEQPLHVGERLLDLAVDHAEEIERNVELDHERVDQHQVADGHRAVRPRRRSRAT